MGLKSYPNRREFSRRTLLAGAAAFSLGACAKPADDLKTLRIAKWGGAGDDDELSRTMREVYREFEREHGVRVAVEGIPGNQEYVSKLLLSFVAGTEPDVMTLDASSAAVFINNGVLMDLTPLLKREPPGFEEQYFSNVLDIARRKEKLYAIPLDFTPMVMYANLGFSPQLAAMLPPAIERGWTWEEFLEVARTASGSGRYGFKFTEWMPGWIMWLWNAGVSGADVLDPMGRQASGFLDSAANINTCQFLADLVTKHRVAPSLSQAAAMGVDLFASGSAALEVSGHWAMIGYKAAKTLNIDAIRVLPLPTQDGSRWNSVMYAASLAIGKNCRKPELAWEFVKHMTSASVQERIQRTGIALCGRRDVAAARATNDQREQDFIQCIPHCRAPWGSRVEGYDFVETAGQKAMESILKSGVAPEVALREAAQNIDEFLSEQS